VYLIGPCAESAHTNARCFSSAVLRRGQLEVRKCLFCFCNFTRLGWGVGGVSTDDAFCNCMIFCLLPHWAFQRDRDEILSSSHSHTP
jgi:hypothetical protein